MAVVLRGVVPYGAELGASGAAARDVANPDRQHRIRHVEMAGVNNRRLGGHLVLLSARVVLRAFHYLPSPSHEKNHTIDRHERSHRGR